MINVPCSLGEDASIRLVMVIKPKRGQYGKITGMSVTHKDGIYYVDYLFGFEDICDLLIEAFDNEELPNDVILEFTMVNVTDDERTRIMRLFNEFTTADSEDSPFNTFMCTIDE